MRVRVREDFQGRDKSGLEHPGLNARAEFYVLGIDNETYRVVNSLGEPILYPKELFEVLDHSIPSGWCFREFEDAEYFLEPVSVGAPGFYEDWHGSDGDRAAQAKARQIFRDELLRLAVEASPADEILIQEALSRLPAGIEPSSKP